MLTEEQMWGELRSLWENLRGQEPETLLEQIEEVFSCVTEPVAHRMRWWLRLNLERAYPEAAPIPPRRMNFHLAFYARDLPGQLLEYYEDSKKELGEPSYCFFCLLASWAASAPNFPSRGLFSFTQRLPTIPVCWAVSQHGHIVFFDNAQPSVTQWANMLGKVSLFFGRPQDFRPGTDPLSWDESTKLWKTLNATPLIERPLWTDVDFSRRFLVFEAEGW